LTSVASVCKASVVICLRLHARDVATPDGGLMPPRPGCRGAREVHLASRSVADADGEPRMSQRNRLPESGMKFDDLRSGLVSVVGPVHFDRGRVAEVRCRWRTAATCHRCPDRSCCLIRRDDQWRRPGRLGRRAACCSWCAHLVIVPGAKLHRWPTTGGLVRQHGHICRNPLRYRNGRRSDSSCRTE
jgi:hypothetical protein